eukprot:3449763-Karenia_brevis.AAC.1
MINIISNQIVSLGAIPATGTHKTVVSVDIDHAFTERACELLLEQRCAELALYHCLVLTATYTVSQSWAG